jgi:miniconductance mechanosensitive channel
MNVDWLELIEGFLRRSGLDPALAGLTAQLLAIVVIVLVCVAANYIARRIILGWVKLLARKTASNWDDILVARGVFKQLAHFAPGLLAYSLLPFAFPEIGALQIATQRLALVYMVVVGALALDALVSALVDMYDTLPIAQTRPINAYAQILKIVQYIVAAILALSVLLDRSPWGFLTGLGAMTAILLLVFKDTILGFVASIQLIANDMVRRGDWIEVPKYGADGNVIKISVATVKVQNWDKSI